MRWLRGSAARLAVAFVLALPALVSIGHGMWMGRGWAWCLALFCTAVMVLLEWDNRRPRL